MSDPTDPTEKTPPAAEGWGWPEASRKAHYFVGATSLCGKWMYTGLVEVQSLGDKPQRDDCVSCWRAQQKREAA
jgi:hypothetical protein